MPQASITVNQVQSAIQATIQLLSEAQGLLQFLNQVNDFATNSWQITQTVGGVTVTTTIDAGTQASLLTQYSALKSALVTTFAGLP